jgi:hypothetical protein
MIGRLPDVLPESGFLFSSPSNRTASAPTTALDRKSRRENGILILHNFQRRGKNGKE